MGARGLLLIPLLVSVAGTMSGCVYCVFDNGQHYFIHASREAGPGAAPVDITATMHPSLAGIRDAIQDAGPDDRSFEVHRSDSAGQERVIEALRELSVTANGTPEWTSVVVDGAAYGLGLSHDDGACTE